LDKRKIGQKFLCSYDTGGKCKSVKIFPIEKPELERPWNEERRI
jgi:hypothetical protein